MLQLKSPDRKEMKMWTTSVVSVLSCLTLALASGGVSAVNSDEGAWQVKHGGIKQIHDVAVDANGTVWVAGSNFGVYDGYGVRAVKYANQQLGLKALEFCGENCGWAAAWHALYRYENDDWVAVLHPEFDMYDLDLVGGTGWAIGRGATGETALLELDGTTWELRQVVSDALTTISMWSETVGWAAGRSGSVYELRDDTWLKMGHFAEMTINGIYARSPTDVWAVGGSFGPGVASRFVILNYDGREWSEIASGDGPALHSVEGLDDMVVAVGESGRIVMYENGRPEERQSTEHRYLGAGEGLRGVTCVTGETCYIGSDDGRLLALDRAGSITRLHDSREITDIEMLGDDVGWIVGEFGARQITEGEWKYAEGAGSVLTSVKADRTGRVWVAGLGGYIAVNENEAFRELGSAPNLDYRDMDLLPTGELCVLGITRGGPVSEARSYVIKVRPDEGTILFDEEDRIEDFVHDITCDDPSGRILAAGVKGLWVNEGKGWMNAAAGEWYSVLQVADGMWLSGRGFLTYVGDQGVKRVDTPGNMVVYDFLADPDCGITAVGSAGIVLQYREEEWQIVSGIASETELPFGIPTRLTGIKCVGSQDHKLWIVGTEGSVVTADPELLSGREIPTSVPSETAVPFTPIVRTGTPSMTTATSTPSATEIRIVLPRVLKHGG